MTKLTFNSKTRIFNNITTNKKSTEIAPTYTIKINIAKNSTPSVTDKHELKKKIKTKAKIEWTGLLVKIINNPTTKNKHNIIQKRIAIKFLNTLRFKINKKYKEKKNLNKKKLKICRFYNKEI